MTSARTKLVAVAALVLALFAGLDRLVYQHLIFLPEYSGGWDQFRWYAFEYHRKQLEKKFPGTSETTPLVLIVGSSIAQYSVQKKLLEAELSRRGTPARVEMLVHASLMASDLRNYLPRILKLKPSVIVYLTNPGDLDLERYSQPWEADPGYQRGAFLDYTRNRHPMLIYYPAQFARQQSAMLGLQEQIRLHLRAFSPGLRFKDEWFAPIQFSMRARRGPVKSYLNYQGVPIREGIWREGRTGACFSLSQDLLDPRQLLVELSPALQKVGSFYVETFSYSEQEQTGRAEGADPMPRAKESFVPRARTCRPPANSRPLTRLDLKQVGWQQAPLPPLPARHDRAFFQLSHVERPDGSVIAVDPGEPVHSGLGLRLPGHFGLRTPPVSDYLHRRLSLDDVRLALLDDRAYALDFAARVHPEDWMRPERAAVHQFNHLRIAKLLLNWREFEMIPLAEELRAVARSIPRTTRFVIVNNPENPLTRESYAGSQWYDGYLTFLRGITAEGQFHDLKDALPMQHFIDAHHLTYYGILRILPEYGRIIAEGLRSQAQTSTPR